MLAYLQSVLHCDTMRYRNDKKIHMNTAMSIRLPKFLAKKLEAVAKDTERSKTFHVQKALETYLEDYADLQIALDRLHDPTDPLISGKELRQELGL